MYPASRTLPLSLSRSTLAPSILLPSPRFEAAAADCALESLLPPPVRRKVTLDSMLDLVFSFTAGASSDALCFPFPGPGAVSVPTSSMEERPFVLPDVRNVCSNEVRSRLNVRGRASDGAEGWELDGWSRDEDATGGGREVDAFTLEEDTL